MLLVDQDKLNHQDNAELLRWMWQHLGAPHRGEEMPKVFLECVVGHVWRQVPHEDRVISCTEQAIPFRVSSVHWPCLVRRDAGLLAYCSNGHPAKLCIRSQCPATLLH